MAAIALFLFEPVLRHHCSADTFFSFQSIGRMLHFMNMIISKNYLKDILRSISVFFTSLWFVIEKRQ